MRIFFLLIFVLAVLVVPVVAQLNGASKIDEIEVYGCDDSKVRIGRFVDEINAVPAAKGYIIVYEGRYRVYKINRNGDRTAGFKLPRVGEVNSRINLIKHALKYIRPGIDNITFVSGGFRKYHTIEFWLIPSGAKSPLPTPSLKKMKYRKGRAPKMPNWIEC